VKWHKFITGLGSAVSWPVALRPQQAATPVIGFLSAGPAGGYAGRVASFRQGLGPTTLRAAML